MKKFLLLLVLVAALCASAFTASASAVQYNCTVQAGQNCIGAYNYWNGHHVHNYGSSQMICGAYQPNGTQQGWATVPVGADRDIAAWTYNHLVCYNATSQTTLWIYSFV